VVLCNERAKQGFVRRQAEVRNKSLLRESIRFMTNSRISQSEKQLASRGRETAARKPHNKQA